MTSLTISWLLDVSDFVTDPNLVAIGLTPQIQQTQMLLGLFKFHDEQTLQDHSSGQITADLTPKWWLCKALARGLPG